MTEAPADITNHVTTIGPGRFILLVGPSGAGKDTLIGLSKLACKGDPSIVFARRVITRPASDSEDNVAVSHEQFAKQLSEDGFATAWYAHGHRYALPRLIQNHIRTGCTVVANVSRTVVAALRRDYAAVVVVAITAPPEVLAERLASRARGSDGQLQDRLTRKIDEAEIAADFLIVNTGCAEHHAGELVQIVKGERLSRKGHVRQSDE